MPNNFATWVLRHAARCPERVALVLPPEVSGLPTTQTVTFGELAEHIEGYRRGLEAAGFAPGDRVVVVFPVSVELYALVLALFASGMVAVLVDMGMGLRRVLQAIEDARAVGMVSVKRLLRWRLALRPLRRLRLIVADGRVRGLRQLRDLDLRGYPQRPALPRSADDEALITFTSGSTGRPKGADRTHGLLNAQHEALAEHFPHHDSDVDCPCFPVVVLHNLCCGVSTVLPAVDLRAPGQVDPERVMAQLTTHNITRLMAAPAFMARLAEAMLARQFEAPAVRAVYVGGGPVSRELCGQLLRAFPNADSQVVYGSTEAEPMTSVSMAEVLGAEDDGDGFLVGHAAPVAHIEVIDAPCPAPTLSDEGIAPWVADIGEIVVKGPHVNRRYIDNPEADRRNKIFEAHGEVWHRTGDVGRWDAQRRLWLLGRVADAVTHQGRMHQPLAVEQACDALDGVRRVALVQHPRARRAILTVALDRPLTQVRGELEDALADHGLAGVPVHPVPFIPTDRRHNTKIDRIRLRLYVTWTWWGDLTR